MDHEEIERLVEEGRLEDALKLVEGLLSKEPEDYDLLLHYAEILEALGRAEEALEVYDKLYELYGDVDLLLAKADLLSRLDRNEEALEVVRRAEEDSPYDRDVKIMKSLILANLGRYREAREVLEKLLEQYPDDPEIMLYLGTILIDEGEDLDRGIDILLQVKEEDPENPYVWYNLGVGLFKLGDYPKAAEAFERADSLFGGEDPDAVYWLAQSMLKLGHRKVAQELAERLLKMGALDAYEEIAKILEK